MPEDMNKRRVGWEIRAALVLLSFNFRIGIVPVFTVYCSIYIKCLTPLNDRFCRCSYGVKL